MIIIHGINKIREFRIPVVALGVFDGVHCGHKEVINAAVENAKALGGTSIVLTFWPHPQKEKSLYSLEHRLHLLEELSVDVCIVVNFNSKFSRIAATDFIKDILVKKLSAKYIYIGKDFRFGKDAFGSMALLKSLGKTFGFKAKGFKTIRYHNEPISSTLIRRMISEGQITKAGKLLGRPVSVLGTVVKGTALGRIIGFPTANINPHHEVIPPSGIYAVRVILGKKRLKGACYIGNRPTIKHHNAKINVEVHILNFKKNLYDMDIEIQFVKRIRSDRKFPSVSLLCRQIKKDLSLVRKILS